MDTIFVTGGAGFIGGCFARMALAQRKAAIVVYDKLTYAGNLDSLSAIENDPKFVFYRGDIADGPMVASLFEKHAPTAVINFAAESHVDRSIDGPAPFVATNVVGTCQLLEASLRYWRDADPQLKSRFRFLHVSTDEVYGSLGPEGLFTESTPYAPNSPYSASKASADHFVRAYHQTYGLPTLITNGSNNYGPYQFPEKLIPLIIQNALAGKPLPIYGDGLNIRDWLHVEDHCRALQLVLEKGQAGQVYNIGGDCALKNLQVVEAICDCLDRLQPHPDLKSRRELITFVEDRPGHDRRYAIDASKIKTELGWSAECGFEAGLEKTVRWYLENREWVRRIASGEYQQERLGLFRGGP